MKKGIRLLCATVGVILLTVVDQLIKVWAIQELKPVGRMDFLKIGSTRILDLTFVENTGASFSSFAGKRWFLVILTGALMVAIAVYLIRSCQKSKFLTAILTMILAGGVGNLIDRLFRGGKVVDYLDLQLFDFAIFNFADILVVVGVILFMIYFIFFDREKKTAVEEKDGRAN